MKDLFILVFAIISLVHPRFGLSQEPQQLIRPEILTLVRQIEIDSVLQGTLLGMMGDTLFPSPQFTRFAELRRKATLEDLFGILDIHEGIALNATGDSLYFIEAGVAAIHRLNLLTNIIETLVTTGLVEPFDLELEANSRKIYWTDRSAGTICRADIDGLNQNVETLVTGLSSPHSLGLDVFENKMYWSTLTGGKIQRADLGGSNVEDVLTGLSTPRGLALDVAVAPSARFVSAAGQSVTISRSKFSASQGNIYSNSVLHFQRGAPTTYTGNLSAVGDIIIDKDNTIVGNVMAGGRIVLGKNSSIIGTATPGANLVALPPDPCVPPDPCQPTSPCIDLIIGAGQSLSS